MAMKKVKKAATGFEEMGLKLCALGEAMLDPASNVRELTALAGHCGLMLEFRIVQPQNRVPANAVSAAESVLRDAPTHFVFIDKDGKERRYIRTDNVGQ